jgi:hypothetical protein
VTPGLPASAVAAAVPNPPLPAGAVDFPGLRLSGGTLRPPETIPSRVCVDRSLESSPCDLLTFPPFLLLSLPPSLS